MIDDDYNVDVEFDVPLMLVIKRAQNKDKHGNVRIRWRFEFIFGLCLDCRLRTAG